jgi:hypothetical protein
MMPTRQLRKENSQDFRRIASALLAVENIAIFYSLTRSFFHGELRFHTNIGPLHTSLRMLEERITTAFLPIQSSVGMKGPIRGFKTIGRC